MSGALLIVNLLVFGVLLAATAARAVRWPRRLWADLIDPRLVFSFFTVVAGTGVLGGGALACAATMTSPRSCGCARSSSGCC